MRRERTTADGCLWVLAVALVALLGLVGPTGCTRESVRVAMETQQRADDVQQAVCDRQQESLRILLYRDLLRRLSEQGVALNDAQRAVVNEVWNDRDLLEFWAIQQERARALRLVGVDAKLAGDQSIIDLLIKSIELRIDRAKEGLASQAGAAAAESLVAPQAPTEADTQTNQGS